ATAPRGRTKLSFTTCFATRRRELAVFPHRWVLDLVLPVLVRDPMIAQMGFHRFADRRVKRIGAEACEKSEALELVLHGVLHLREAELDTLAAQAVVELGDAVGCSDVDARHGF